MTPKLVIFDCDGVLVDSEPVTDVVIANNLTRHGLPMTPEETHTLFVGGTLKGVGDTARARGAILPDTWLADLYVETFAALAKGVPVFPGVFALLDKLDAAGIPTAIASNGPMAKMDVTLTPSGLITRFTSGIYSGHDYVPKPDPAMLLHACTVAGVAPSDAIMIDDSVPGCLSAKAAGVPCFGFRPTGDGTALEAVGATVVRSMEEIASAIALR